MSLQATTRTMNSYFEALSGGADFGRFFTDDVQWTTMETDEKIVGQEPVRDFIVTMHRKVFDAHPEFRSLAIADGIAVLEADFVGTHTGEFSGIAATGAAVRFPHCVVYDVDDRGIKALRAYLPMRWMAETVRAAQNVRS